MYQDWIVERWDTPVSDGHVLSLVLLADYQSRLTLVVEALRNGEPYWVAFTFTAYIAYRNIFEEYRLALWENRGQSGISYGTTMIVTHAPWSDTFGDEPLVDVHNPTLQHYLLCTEDDVVEVWANTPPTIVTLDHLGTNAGDRNTTLLGLVLRNGQ